MRALLAATLAVALAPPPLAAQRFWRTTLYPYVFYSTVDGFWGGAHFGIYSPIGFAERPEPNLAAVNFDAGASTQGSYAAVADFQAPAWWDGWRVGITLTATRANRLGYYGLGNGTVYDADSVTAARPYFYRVSRTNQSARLTVQRRLAGPLRVLAGATVDRTNFRELPGESLFRRDHAAGVVDSGTVPYGDAVARVGLVLDTRDHEIDPHGGVFVEALYSASRDYTRATVGARAYLRPLERLVLAARAAGERMGGTPPLAAQVVMESSERPFVAVGGYRSLRGYYDARFAGHGKLLGGVEARYALLWAPTVLELKLVAFYDVGRVFGPGERFRVTTNDLHSGGGGEIALRLLRNSLIVLGAGFGGEGGQLLFGTNWSY